MPRPKRDLIRANYYLPTKVVAALRKLAEKKACSVSELVRDALRQYVVAEVKKLSEEKPDDGLASDPAETNTTTPES